MFMDIDNPRKKRIGGDEANNIIEEIHKIKNHDTRIFFLIVLAISGASLAKQAYCAKKDAKEWRKLYFKTRDEAQELFDENLELTHRSNKSW